MPYVPINPSGAQSARDPHPPAHAVGRRGMHGDLRPSNRSEATVLAQTLAQALKKALKEHKAEKKRSASIQKTRKKSEAKARKEFLRRLKKYEANWATKRTSKREWYNQPASVYRARRSPSRR